MAGYIGQAPANKFLTLDKQTFTTSATDTYSLDRTVSSANEIELFLNNVRQEPIEAYTVSGSTLTLASAITSSDTMYCIYQGKAIGTVSPSTNSVSNGMLVNSSITVNGTSIDLGASGNISAGITMADHWRLTTNFTGSGNGEITTNLARVTDDSFSPIGSGMSESSGVFTFPSTGMYLIMAHGDFLSGGSSSGFSSVFIKTTTDNSTYTNRTISWTSIFTASVYGQTDNNQLFNVTNTTTHKVKFGYELNNSQTIEGSTSNIRTHFIFIRLGDSQ
jgi:hypothetical protein